MLLLVALVSVILIAKKFAVVIEGGLAWLNAPKPFAGVVVALIVLAPESIAAIAAARLNVLQKSVNLALGCALATIGLTIPAVGVATIVLGTPVVLGLAPRETLLLAITLFVGSLTLGTGRTNILSGLVHLVLFATFLFLLFVP
jgi:Ca2+:H+ antiporter